MANIDSDCAKLERKVDKHIEECTLHRSEYLERQLHQDIAHEKNMIAISKLTESTQGVVDAWSTANNFQKFAAWLSKFAVLVALIAWIVNKIPASVWHLIK